MRKNCLFLSTRIAAVAMCLASATAYADSWKYPPVASDRTFKFGSTQVVLTTDARKDQQLPDFQVRVLLDGQEQARFSGVAFDELYASPDNALFLGLSNSGLPGTAVVLFTSKGRIGLLANHGLAEFDYCSKSVTLERVWYDEKSPRVQFDLDGKNGAPGIYLQDCKGRTVELIRTVQNAYARAAEHSASTPRR